jgi:16S rRNA G966 N2-methylase RsmD
MAKKSINKQSKRLFEEKLVPAKPGSGELFEVSYGDDHLKPVECLGMTFPNDGARRAHFTEKLREKLKDPAFRKIAGFPIGDDEDILALSDPPYYTACPNPFIDDFMRTTHSQGFLDVKDYHRNPFAADISVARHDPFSLGHTYHTKVSPFAVAQYVNHFTNPGDVVLDFFCGSGMTGIGSTGLPLLTSTTPATFAGNAPRNAILVDLSPAATHISNGNMRLFSSSAIATARSVLEKARCESLPLFAVPHMGHISKVGAWNKEPLTKSDEKTGYLEFLVFSEIQICPSCSGEIVFGNIAFDLENQKVKDTLVCPSCGLELEKRQCKRKQQTYLDPFTKEPGTRPLLVPLFTAYDYGGKRFYRRALASDVGPHIPISAAEFPAPAKLLRGERFFKDALDDIYGLRYIHDFYTLRNLVSLQTILSEARSCDTEVATLLRYLVTSIAIKASKLMNFNADTRGRVMKGTLYQSSLVQECNPFWMAGISLGDIERMAQASRHDRKHVVISTASASRLGIAENSVDYVWIDPPFGKNLMYAELNQIWEWWLGLRTAEIEEGVIDERRGKTIQYYKDSMAKCFSEAFRVLKPGRWMTIEFHNSKNAVWNAIQEAISRAGFVVADVRLLDKKLMTYKQSQQGLVKQDLVISAYKPTADQESVTLADAASENSSWDFVRYHLQQLPVFVESDGLGEIVAERQDYLLFDRMLAFHIQRSLPVPISASEFYAGLRERYPNRDGMFFLPEQVSEYDRKRMEVRKVEQLTLYVSDEKSAIQWLRRQLEGSSLSYQVLQPLFMKEAQRVWDKHEQRLELQTLLDQNFVSDSDGNWRLPNANTEADLEQIRHRALMKEFQKYLDTKGKLKIVRTEALRAGFKEFWQKKDYTTIVELAKRLPDAVIQEDQALLMYFDNASLLKGE